MARPGVKTNLEPQEKLHGSGLWIWIWCFSSLTLRAKEAWVPLTWTRQHPCPNMTLLFPCKSFLTQGSSSHWHPCSFQDCCTYNYCGTQHTHSLSIIYQLIKVKSWIHTVKITEVVLVVWILQAGKWELGPKSVTLKTECFDMSYLQ